MGRGWLITALALLPSLAGAESFYTLRGHGGPIRDVFVAAPPPGAADAAGSQPSLSSAASGPDAILTAGFDYSVGYWLGGTPRWLEGHRAAVNAARFIGTQRAVSAGDDNSLIFWDLTTGTGRTRAGHRAKVVALDYSRPAGLVASAGWDGRIGLWRADGEGEPRFLEGHGGPVHDVVFGPGGRTVYSASQDGTLRLWDVTEGKELRTLVANGFGVNAVTLAPDGAWLAYGTVDGIMRVIDPASGAQIADFTLGGRAVLSLAVNGRGDRLAVGDAEGYIMLIDTGGWRLLRDFRAAARGPVWSLSFSGDGSDLLAAGLGDTVFAWPVESLGLGGQEMAGDGAAQPRTAAADSPGAVLFRQKCEICHMLGPDSGRRAGPTLLGLFGRRAGSLADYAYSPLLENSDIVWTDETIDALFDLGPDHFVPGSKMPMQRIGNAADRESLIAFLKSATDPMTNGTEEEGSK